jgi:heterodisulfide reductase subunit A-like polyferredoxin
MKSTLGTFPGKTITAAKPITMTADTGSTNGTNGAQNGQHNGVNNGVHNGMKNGDGVDYGKDVDYAAIVVGAGFGGLRMLHELRKLGLSTRVLEAGEEIGGAW